MFPTLVTNLSFSPSVNAQLTYYLHRLNRAQVARQVSVIIGCCVLVLQAAAWIAPPTPATASSPNDIIYGGLVAQSPRADLLKIYDADHDSYGHTGYQRFFEYFGINRTILASTHLGTISSNLAGWVIVGRLPYATSDQKVVIGNQIYYARALDTWSPPVEHSALLGVADGSSFAILTSSADLAIPASAMPAPLLGSSSGKLQMVSSATLVNSTSQTTAQPGDTVLYQTAVTNTGVGPQLGYVQTQDVSDILEYAKITNAGGGKLVGDELVWPKTNIQPNATLNRSFRVKIDDPIPTTPRSSSDPYSYNLQMLTVFGNSTVVHLATPSSKQLEMVDAQLPFLDPGIGLAIILVVVLLAIYGYLRSRQLAYEVAILRADQRGELE